MKGKQMKTKMNTIYAAFAVLILACFALSPAVKAQGRPFEGGSGIVGLWLVHYTSDFGPQFDTYQQWYKDGLEIESPSFSLGQCQGTWEQTANRTIQLYHVGWTPGGVPPAPTSVRFVLTEVLTVSQDRNTFDGAYDQKFYDADGNVVLEDTGTTHATRISVN
jgi:hypothetical protein